MILLVTPSQRASECAVALHAATGDQVMTAQSLARATMLLRAHSFRVVVLEQHLLEAEPDQACTMFEHLDTAMAVPVNLAITGMDRLARDVLAATERRQREEIQARHAANSRLQSELNGTVTALLLSIELARETPGLPLGASEKLQSVHDLVKRLRAQLESSSLAENTYQAAGATSTG
jgi:hypothetical protein